jgi:hypothetical protein
VPNEDDRAVESIKSVGDDRSIVIETSEREIDGRDVVTQRREFGNRRFPTPAAMAKAMDEHEL